jgi:mono/diheme cytochrome c family protein
MALGRRIVSVKWRYIIAGLAFCFSATGIAIGIAPAQPEASGSVLGPKAPDAAALSFTAAQAASGQAEYTASCVDCHGPNLNDGEFGGPPLKGGAFRAKWFRLPVSALVSYARAAMPPDSPGRLPLGTYVEIVAYLLNANGISPGERELPADLDALRKLRVVAESGATNGH